MGGMGGEREDREVREREEENIVESIKFLKVIHGGKYWDEASADRKEGFIIHAPPAYF